MEAGQSAETIIITDEELRSLTDAIQQRHGIDFSCYEPKSLKRRVVRALHKFNLKAVHELWMRILRDHGFIYPFMDEISVGLTAMFRDPQLWSRMKGLLANEYRIPGLSIWHAGCSTGEEVYTMGIVLRESEFPHAVNGLATDISNQAMETARKGAYHLMKMEEYEQNYVEYNPGSTLKKYYLLKDNEGTLDPRLISHVTFEHHNLITSPFTRKFDIIFCRNVMIYFDMHAKLKLFRKFYQSLNDGGLLIIGFYDSVMPLVDPNLFSVYDIDNKILRKVPEPVLVR